MPNRRHVLNGILADYDADALWLSFLPDVRWACGFSGSNGLLVVTAEGAHFITDGRYETQAADEIHGAEVHVTSGDLVDAVVERQLLDAATRVIVQADHLSVAAFDSLQRKLPDPDWVRGERLLVQQVASKSAAEIEALRRAQAVTDEVFLEVLDLLREGVTEQAIAAEIVHAHLVRGAERMSFEPIVAFGPNAALPHARPTARKLRTGDAVLMDFGCFLDGYASDMTRTVVLGAPEDELTRVYDLVKHAQEAALKSARSGMRTDELDAAARSVIDEAGYGEQFAHSLGHGLGLQIHEWPRVSWRDEDVLPDNAVVTIEPGIYLPGRFGVRIEDTVVLRPDGCENLTRSTKDLIVL